MRGTWTALVTPFSSTGKIDELAWAKLLRLQREAGVAGVVPCGTTGESPTLSVEEKKFLISSAISEFKGTGVGVMAGTGSNNTSEAIELSVWAAGAGVRALLIVTPYYNRPSQAGLESHFRAIADAVDCEIMLYNVPGRTGVSLTADTVVRLSAHPGIRSIKEATGNVSFSSEIRERLLREDRQLDILSGDDACFLPLLSVGATGVVSVASNLFPAEMVALQQAYEAGRCKAAQDVHDRYYPLFRDLFVESNPSPIKEALSYVGLCGSTVRAPLAPLTETSRDLLIATLQRCGFREGMYA